MIGGTRLSRRQFVLAAAMSASGFAGCLEGDTSDEPTTDRSTDPASPSQPRDPDGATSIRDDSLATTDGLDLREANVTAVSLEPRSGGSYRFAVTLYHDDDGEQAYADWWQVERLDGTQLGRRTLLHAHSTAPFTRSTTVEIPGDVDCVVVRGHDQTHGYGGRAAIVSVPSGVTRFVDQGPDPAMLADSTCP